jgi:hypothetical protein
MYDGDNLDDKNDEAKHQLPSKNKEKFPQMDLVE